jgi:hypothetical protein
MYEYLVSILVEIIEYGRYLMHNHCLSVVI